MKLAHYRDILEDERTRRALAELLLRIKKLCRHILPGCFKARLHFGMDDPASTGEFLGFLCMFYPLYGEHIKLEPDFESKCFDTDLYMKGHIQLIFVLIAGLKIYFNKDIRNLWKEIKNGG